MAQINDLILKRLYTRSTRRTLGYSFAVLLIGLLMGYLTGSPYPNLIAALFILLLFVQLFIFKQRLAKGAYPATDHEHDDLRRFLEKEGGAIVPGMTLD